jgi:hypothetical protein
MEHLTDICILLLEGLPKGRQACGGQPPPQLAYVPAQQGQAPQLLTFSGATVPGRTVLTHLNGIPVPDPARVSLRFVHVSTYEYSRPCQ